MFEFFGCSFFSCTLVRLSYFEKKTFKIETEKKLHSFFFSISFSIAMAMLKLIMNNAMITGIIMFHLKRFSLSNKNINRPELLQFLFLLLFNYSNPFKKKNNNIPSMKVDDHLINYIFTDLMMCNCDGLFMMCL